MTSGSGGYVKIRVDFISAQALTEFCLRPNGDVNKDSEAFPDENDISSQANTPEAPFSFKSVTSELNKKRPLNREKSITLMINNNGVNGNDPDNGNWQVDCDLNSSFLRCSMVFQDVYKIPRNHLR